MMSGRVFIMILCVLLVFVWALSKLIHAQRRLRLTMQHVYGHECADHVAALGTFGAHFQPQRCHTMDSS